MLRPTQISKQQRWGAVGTNTKVNETVKGCRYIFTGLDGTPVAPCTSKVDPIELFVTTGHTHTHTLDGILI